MKTRLTETMQRALRKLTPEWQHIAALNEKSVLLWSLVEAGLAEDDDDLCCWRLTPAGADEKESLTQPPTL